jgi:hypothetical protein
VTAMSGRERTSVLVVRVWSHEGEGLLRARIVAADDVRSGNDVTLLAGSQRSVAGSGVDEISRIVRRWLEALARDADEPPRRHVTPQ